MVKRLLRRIGLVPLAKYQKVSSDLAVWQGRAKKFSDETERLKTELRRFPHDLGIRISCFRARREPLNQRATDLLADASKYMVSRQPAEGMSLN